MNERVIKGDFDYQKKLIVDRRQKHKEYRSLKNFKKRRLKEFFIHRHNLEHKQFLNLYLSALAGL